MRCGGKTGLTYRLVEEPGTAAGDAAGGPDLTHETGGVLVITGFWHSFLMITYLLMANGSNIRLYNY